MAREEAVFEVHGPGGGEGEVPMTPDRCRQCRDEFLRRPALQAEVRHEVAIHGQAAAVALLRDRLEAEHEQHDEPNAPCREEHR